MALALNVSISHNQAKRSVVAAAAARHRIEMASMAAKSWQAS